MPTPPELPSSPSKSHNEYPGAPFKPFVGLSGLAVSKQRTVRSGSFCLYQDTTPQVADKRTVLKGHGFSRAVGIALSLGFSP
jgi:hypothetical protein